MNEYIKKYFLGNITIERLCYVAKQKSITSDELIEQMNSWRILLESEHAEDLIALDSEVAEQIKAIMGDKPEQLVTL